VSRRAVVDVVRAATLGSYGVIGFSSGVLPERLASWLGIAPAGLKVRLSPELAIELDLVVAHGLPIAEVARQVDSAIRYAVRRALDRDVAHLTIRVDGLRVAPLDVLGADGRRATDTGVTPDDLAGSGTDVA
jgi:uncharacterized alkaline shock family protein YloU